MRFKTEFNLDNAAFEDNPPETAAVLRRIAEKVNYLAPKQEDSGLVHDSNGNTIGEWHILE